MQQPFVRIRPLPSVTNPVPSRPPFGAGRHPIQPVSRCLSAAGFRFLGHHPPAGEFRRACAGPTVAGPRQGYHVSHDREAAGVDVLYTAGARCLRAPIARGSIGCPIVAASAVTATSPNAASSRLHLRSPVRSPPCPVTTFGSQFPWALPRASHLTVASDACRGWRQA